MSLDWVRAFEASARLGTVSAAAVELQLTQSAVSLRIRHLERRLGIALFERRARGVVLTVAGEAWLPHVRLAIAQIDNSAANLFASPRRRIALSASASLIELWLAPRLGAIRQRLPHVQIELRTIEIQMDYDRQGSDAQIRFGKGRWPGFEAKRLFAEELAPLASPKLVQRAGKEWWRLPQIALTGPRAGWRDWAAAHGESPPPAPVCRFDTFAHALAAAEAGVGVLLGSLPLSEQALRQNRLVRLSPRSLRMDEEYWITWRETPTARKDLAEFVAALSR